MEIRAILKRELSIWFQYSIITAIAASSAYFTCIEEKHALLFQTADVNMAGMIGLMFTRFLFPLFSMFTGLSVLRVCFLLVVSRFR